MASVLRFNMWRAGPHGDAATLCLLALLAVLAGCAAKGATEEERRTRLFLAPGSMGLSLAMPSGGFRGLAYYTYSRMLRHAAQRGDNQEAARCMTLGGDLNARDSYGWSALTLAVREGQTQTAAFLVETKVFKHGQGVSTNDLQTAIKDEALAVAVEKRNVEVVTVLLRNGASATAANDQGQSVLMRAAYVGDPTIVRMLLAAGADPNAQDSTGLRALDWAEKSGCRECVGALREGDNAQ